MSLISQLGTTLSYLGNIELGAGVSPDSILTVAGIAAITLSPNNVINCSLTIDGIAAISELGDTNSLTVASIADITLSDINVINCSLTIAGTSAISVNPGFNVNSSIILHSIDTFNGTLSGINYSVSITVSAIDSLTTYLTDEAHIIINALSYCDFGILGFENPAGIAATTTTAVAIFNRIISQTLDIEQTIIGLKSIINQSEILNLSQTINLLHIHNPSLTQTLTFTQDAIGFFDVSQTLDILQTILSTKIKNLNIIQILNLIQTPLRNIVSNHNILHTLIFNPIKLINSQLITTSGRFNYYKPNILVTKISNQPILTLVSNNQLIDLPSPQFGDTQAYSGTINLKRTMTGLTYTYIKKSTLNKLNYSFNLGRPKSLELRQFLYNNSDKIITLYNWKGEIWYTVIINNPFEFVISERYQKEQERIDITLEFEGVKLA